MKTVRSAADVSVCLSYRLTFVRALADVEEQMQDEVQVDLLVVEAVMIRFEQLLVLRAQFRRGRLDQRRLVQLTRLNTPSVQTHTAHCNTQTASERPNILVMKRTQGSHVRLQQIHSLGLTEVSGPVQSRPEGHITVKHC